MSSVRKHEAILECQSTVFLYSEILTEMRSYFPQKITEDMYGQKSPFAHYNNCISLPEVTTVTILELVFFCVYVFTYVEIYNCIL